MKIIRWNKYFQATGHKYSKMFVIQVMSAYERTIHQSVEMYVTILLHVVQ
jgi:hypothetical protein